MKSFPSLIVHASIYFIWCRNRISEEQGKQGKRNFSHQREPKKMLLDLQAANLKVLLPNLMTKAGERQ